MKTVLWKAYWNFEKEERWLNEMSAKGMAMTDYSWCRYVFADSEPGEYTYRLELLEHLPSHPESQKYLRFMEDSGAEHVASYMRWVYFRKKAADGAFDIYSDAASKLKHYRRVCLFFTVLACVEFFIGLYNILLWLGLSMDAGFRMFYTGNIILGCIAIGVGLAFIIMLHPLRKKIKRLRQDMLITE